MDEGVTRMAAGDRAMARNLCKILGVATLTVCAMLLGVYTLRFTAPFLCGKLLAMAVEPAVAWMARRHVPRKAGALIALLLLIGTLGVALFFLVNQALGQGLALIERLPEIWPDIQRQLEAWLDALSSGMNLFPEDLVAAFEQAFHGMLGALDGWVEGLAQGAWRTAAALPGVMAFVVFTLMGAYFFSTDREMIALFLHRQLPSRWLRAMHRLRVELFQVVFGYAKAQLMILGVILVILWIGLSILGVDYALALAVIIALGDALPILGAGAFLLPWALISLLSGNRFLALGLAILYGVAFLTREGLEPHLVSGRIGLHPLATMASMFVGLKMWGVLGMVFGPVSLLLLRCVLRYYTKGRTLAQLLRQSPPRNAVAGGREA